MGKKISPRSEGSSLSDTPPLPASSSPLTPVIPQSSGIEESFGDRVVVAISPPVDENVVYRQISNQLLKMRTWIYTTFYKSLEELDLTFSEIDVLERQISRLTNEKFTTVKQEFLSQLTVFRECLKESREQCLRSSSYDPLARVFLSDRIDLPLFDHWDATVVYIDENNQSLLTLEGCHEPSKQQEHLRKIENLLFPLEREEPFLCREKANEALKQVESSAARLQEVQELCAKQKESVKRAQKKEKEQQTAVLRKQIEENNLVSQLNLGSERFQLFDQEINASKCNMEQDEICLRKSQQIVQNLEKEMAILKEKGSDVSEIQKRVSEINQDINRYQTGINRAIKLQRDNKGLREAEKLLFLDNQAQIEKMREDLVRLEMDLPTLQKDLYNTKKTLQTLEEQVSSAQLDLSAAQQDVISLLSPAQRELRFYRAALLAASSEVSDVIQKKCEERGSELGPLKEKKVTVQRQGDDLSVVIEMVWEVSSAAQTKARCTFTLQPLIGKCVPLDVVFESKRSNE